jgi:hypothetical protein
MHQQVQLDATHAKQSLQLPHASNVADPQWGSSAAASAPVMPSQGEHDHDNNHLLTGI